MVDKREQSDRIVSLVARGVGLRQGDKVSIFMTDTSVIDIVAAFVDLCYRTGAFPQVMLTDERFDLSALAHATADVLSRPAPMEAAAMAWSDVHVSFRAMVPPLAGVDPGKVAALKHGRGAVSTMRWQGTRWALVKVPTSAWSEYFGLSSDAIFEEWLAGFQADWDEARTRMQSLCEALAAVREVEIRDADTALRLPVAGRVWVPFAGNENWPDGELATAPVETDVSGHITFPGTFVFGGVVIRGLRICFEDGQVSEIEAGQGGDFVRRLMAGDPGAVRVGEFGIGTNAALRTMTGDLLIDEKIAGTAHIALGRAYPECGGLNRSSLHWDIVKDLRGPEGCLLVDGVPLIDHGIVQPQLAAVFVGRD